MVSHSTLGERFHLRGRILPHPEPIDLWVVEGKISFDPVPGANTLATDSFILPGLADLHCHIGLGLEGAISDELVYEQMRAELAAGVMVMRDCGSPKDTRFVQRDQGLPLLIRSGRHIARSRRYIRHAAIEIEPEQLVEEMRRQAQASDGWVKLVGDWIDRSVGDLAPSFPPDVLAQGIAAAHAEGARVTAHCFAEQSVREIIEAGVDCIEHGTGLDDETIELMAKQRVALVPTMINLNNFPDYAAQGEGKFPTYSAHMRQLHRRRYDTIGKAFDAGIEIYAGTDAGTVVRHGRIVDEVEELARVGGAEFAVGAASWRARTFLDVDTLTEGASADILVFEEDPRENVGLLRDPRYKLLRGKLIDV